MMRYKKCVCAITPLVLALSWFCGEPAAATVLVFEPASDGAALNQDYGDHVTAATQNGFFYGIEGGFTPHIAANYATGTRLWTSGYGDLANVVYQDPAVAHVIEITLTAEPGWEVILESFDLASFALAVDPINAVQVVDGEGSVLFQRDDAVIDHPGHSTFQFDPSVVANELTIRIDSSNLRDIFSAGSSSDFVAIDNVRFAERRAAIPEPASFAVMSVCGLLVLQSRSPRSQPAN